MPSESRIAIGWSLGATTWLGIRWGTVERRGSAVTSLVIPTQKFAALPPGGAGGALPGTPGSDVVIPGPYRPVHGRSAPGRPILPRSNGGSTLPRAVGASHFETAVTPRNHRDIVAHPVVSQFDGRGTPNGILRPWSSGRRGPATRCSAKLVGDIATGESHDQLPAPAIPATAARQERQKPT